MKNRNLAKITLASAFFTANLNAADADSEAAATTSSNEQFICAYPEQAEGICQQSDTGNTENSDQPFATSPILVDALQIDLRPENCQSFFDDYLHTRRGLRIESALVAIPEFQNYQSTVSTFPVADFYSHGHVHVVKTRDLTAESFQDNSPPGALYEQIINDAEDVHERFLNTLSTEGTISATALGRTTTIGNNQVSSVGIDMIIQTGIASTQQISQIERAKSELQQRWGFELRVIEIP